MRNKNQIRFESTSKSDLSSFEFLKTLAIISLPHVALLAIFLVYSCIGAAILQEIEHTVSPITSDFHVKTSYHEVQSILSLIRDAKNNGNSTFDDLSNILLKHYTRYNENLEIKENQSVSNNELTFKKSIFFIFSLLSTMGDCGQIPSSKLSKLFLILYSLIGVPLTIILLHDFGTLITCFIKFIMRFMNAIMISDLSDATITSFDETNAKFDFSLTSLSTIIFAYLSVGALFFRIYYNWSLCDSFFYAFISISKISITNDLHTNDSLEADLFLFFYYLSGVSFFSLAFKYLAINLRALLLKNGRSCISNLINLKNCLSFLNFNNDTSLHFSFSNDSSLSTSTTDDDLLSLSQQQQQQQQQRRKSVLMRKRTSILQDLNTISHQLHVIKCDKQTQITTLLACKT